MSKQANKTVIGGFVVGAAAIVLIGIMVFGGGKFFTDKDHYVLFFTGSVKGLNVGAPVQLKGVPVGQVKDISLLADPVTFEFYTRVLIETLPEKIKKVGAEKEESAFSDGEADQIIQMLIKRGLRAKLELISLVTGQLLVSFDFYPNTVVRKTGFKTEYKELPTLPSDMEAWTKKLEKIPFGKLVNELLTTVEAIKKVVQSPKIQNIMDHSDQMIQDVGNTARKIDEKATLMSKEVTMTAQAARNVFNHMDRKIDPIAEGVDTTLKSAATALDQASETSLAIKDLVGENSELRYNLRHAMQEISSAAAAVRVLADYLEQHPEAVLKGKSGGE